MKEGGKHGPRAALTVASLALFTDALLYGLAVPVLPLLASDQGASSVGVGLLFAAYAAALLAFTPIAGLAVDRLGTRSTMLAGLGALAAATLLLVVVAAPALLGAARALQGPAAAVTWTASLALIAETHPPRTRGPAMGIALSRSASASSRAHRSAARWATGSGPTHLSCLALPSRSPTRSPASHCCRRLSSARWPSASPRSVGAPTCCASPG